MGVDYYDCEACGEIYCDCGPCGYCDGCDAMLCIDCYDKSVEKYGKDEEHDHLLKCVLCQKDVITDATLVPFLLSLAGMTREQAENEIRGK